MGFQSTLVWKLLEGRVLVGRPSIWSSFFSHDAKAPDGLIVTRDTSFFKTYCYLIASLESFMSHASGTRKRPPQSGFVQTGMWEITPGKSASFYECVRSCRYTIYSDCSAFGLAALPISAGVT